MRRVRTSCSTPEKMSRILSRGVLQSKWPCWDLLQTRRILSCILQLTDTCLFGQQVKSSERVPCVCTAVVFCSTTCRAKAVVHKCPGAPAERVDLDEMMRREREKGPGSVNGMARDERDAFTQELERTVTGPIREAKLRPGAWGSSFPALSMRISKSNLQVAGAGPPLLDPRKARP